MGRQQMMGRAGRLVDGQNPKFKTQIIKNKFLISQGKNKALLDVVCVPEPGSHPLSFDSPFAISRMAQFR